MLQKFKADLKFIISVKFKSRDYFPVLNEFVLSNSGTSIGGQPIGRCLF